MDDRQEVLNIRPAIESAELGSIDVDEVACLIDFGVDTDTVLDSLEKLNVVRVLANEPLPNDTQSLQAR